MNILIAINIFASIFLFETALVVSACQESKPLSIQFDNSKILGTWYTAARAVETKDIFKCLLNQIEKKSANQLQINSNAISIKNGATLSYTKNLQVIGEPSHGKFNITSNDDVDTGINQVIAADYDYFILAYECNPVHNKELAYVLTRKRKVSPEFIQHMRDTLKCNGINGVDLIPTAQDGCNNN